MHASATTFAKISAFILTVASVAAVSYAIISLAQTAMFYERSERTTGVAISLGHRKTVGSRPKETFTTMVVEFTTITSGRVHVNDVAEIDSRNTDVGDSVALRYDPDNPAHVVSDSIPAFLLLNFLPLAAGIFGLTTLMLLLFAAVRAPISDT